MVPNPRRIWAVVALLSQPVGGATFAQPPNVSLDESTVSTWTLEEALARARRDSPVLRRAEARLQAARADLVEARTYPFNPEIGVEAAERAGPVETSTDRGVALGQEIEIGGQRGKRVRAADVALAAAESSFSRAEQELTNQVELAFASGLAEEQRVEIARAELALVEKLLTFEDRRLEAGAGTQLDLNLARAAAGRVRQTLQETLAARAGARTALAEVVGIDPVSPPTPVGAGREPLPELASLPELVDRALEVRPDLAASRSALEAARRQVELQRRLALPNLRLGLFTHREEGDDITGGAVGLAIPLFDRNQGGVARAEAQETGAAAELAAAELAVRRSVADAHARYQAAAEAVEALDALVVGTLEESLELLGRALEAGKVSAGEVIVLRRELVEAQRQHVQAELDLAMARSDLVLAAGGSALSPRIPQPAKPGGS
jgi:cobalt-zinc-cadmium efflux system outer membrane protein